MLKSVLMPLAIGTAVAMGGAAFADSATTKTPYKETPTKAQPNPMDKSVSPDAQLNKERYSNTPDPDSQVSDRVVNPDAKINKERYKESGPKSPEAMEKTTK